MLESEYLADAQRLVRLAMAPVKKEMIDDEVIQSGLLFALGIEKLLKYILARVNPVFILKAPDFKHAAAALYADKIVKSQKHEELSDKPDSDVITFRVSLGRAKVFSKSTAQSSQMLYSVANWRDVIAHRPTSELDMRSVSAMLTKDAVRVLSEMCTEHSLNIDDFLGDHSNRLRKLSAELTAVTAFADEMKALLLRHKNIWTTRSSNSETVELAKAATHVLLLRIDTDEGAFESVKCPACNNPSAVHVEADYDYADGESYIAGVYAEYLHCYYCDLKLNTYPQLSYVDVDKLLADNYA